MQHAGTADDATGGRAVDAPPGVRRSAWHAGYGLLVTSLIGLTGCLAALEVVLSVAMVRYPAELMFGEAILYAHARRLLDGAPLYQTLDRVPYAAASYPPLFYACVAVLQALVGPGFGPGRTLAVVCLGVCGMLVGLLAANGGGGARCGVLAGLLFVALGVPGSGTLPWTALYKEDSLALLMVLVSLVLLSLTERGAGASVATAAGLLSALSILTKQTYAPMALAAAGWLWSRDRRLCFLFLAAALVPIAGVSLVLQLTTRAFFENALLANITPFDGKWLAANLQLLVLVQTGPLIAAGTYWAMADRKASATDVLVLWAMTGAALQVVAVAKLGGASNHFMALSALSAVFAARAVYAAAGRPRLACRAQWLAVVCLAGGLLLVAPLLAEGWLGTLNTLGPWTAANGNEFSGVIAQVRDSPGEVLAEPLDVIALANRQPSFDPLLFSMFFASGRWDADAVVRRICDGSVSLIVVDRPIDTVEDWPTPVRVAIEHTMQLQRSAGGRLLYLPSMEPGTASCG